MDFTQREGASCGREHASVLTVAVPMRIQTTTVTNVLIYDWIMRYGAPKQLIRCKHIKALTLSIAISHVYSVPSHILRILLACGAGPRLLLQTEVD